MIIEKHYNLVINEYIDPELDEVAMSPIVVIGNGYSVDVTKMVRLMTAN